MSFDFQVRHEPEFSLVNFSGKLTAANSQTFLQDLGDSMQSEEFSLKVLVDMSKVEYLDSSGIGALLTLHKRFLEDGGHMVFHSITPAVSAILTLLNLQKVFSIADDAQSAQSMLETVS